jgi:hypothetical protein
MLRYLKAGIVVLLSLSIFGYLWTAISVLRFPYAVDYGEAPLVDQARRILTHQIVYKSDLSAPPYTIANYPPVYPFLQAGLSYLTGASLLLSGRLLSLVAAITSAGILTSFTRSLTGSNLPALATLGLFLGHPYVITWSSLARVDFLALLFCLSALWILYRRWHSWRWTLLALGCLLVCVYTRQTYLLAGPLAAFAWLWSRDRRRAAIFGTVFITAVLGVFFLFNAYTQGGFSVNIIQANINRVDFSSLLTWVQQFILIWPVILGGSLAFIWATLAGHFRHSEPLANSFVTWGLLSFLAGSIFSSLTVGKVGSSVNYFLELIAALAILSSLALHSLSAQKPFIKNLFYLAITCQLIWLVAGAFFVHQSTISDHWAQLDRYRQLEAQIQAASLTGPVLTDDYLGLVVASGQPIYYQPFEYGQLYHAGLWDPQEMAHAIRSGRFSLILIGGDTLDKPCCWPSELTTAIKERYQVDSQPELIVCTPLPASEP